MDVGSSSSSDLREKQLLRLLVGIAQPRHAASFLPGWCGPRVTRVVFSIGQPLLNCLRVALDQDWDAFRHDCPSKMSIFKGEINSKSFVGAVWDFFSILWERLDHQLLTV